MTPDRNDPMPEEADEHGVLPEVGGLETSSIGILSGAATEQVTVTFSVTDDDDATDDDVVDDEQIDLLDAGDLVIDPAPAVAVPELETVEATVDDDDDEPTAEDDTMEDDTAEHDTAEHVPADVIDDVDDIHGADAVDGVADLEESDSTAEVLDADEDLDEPGADASIQEVVEEAVDAVEAPPLAEASAQPVPADVPSIVVAATPAREIPAATGSIPTTRREAHQTGSLERVIPVRQDQELAAKRVGDFEPDRESSDLLTADRLLDQSRVSGAEPEGLWQQLVYTLSGRRINLGDSRRSQGRKQLDRRIAAPLHGGARFVPVLSRKGGVGKTTVTTLLGMALASAREDRIIALDANPDRGTLADRISSPSGRTVRDLVRMRDEVTGYNDVSGMVARDETRLDVIASDADPTVSEAFNDRDYRDVATLAAHYYSIVLTDTGTGIVHSVMGATLALSDELVIVSGMSVDEARLAAETLTWLETNGYAAQVRNAVVVLNNARPGTPLVRESELEAHFASRVRAVVRMPYDPLVATGSTISFRELRPETRAAARELAAAVVEGLDTLAPAA